MRTSAAVSAALSVTALLSLFLLVPSTDALGSASTIAITDSSNTVCGILAGSSPRSVQCAAIGSSQPLPALPNVSFDSLSGGRRFLCGLRSGGLGLFCWNASSSGVTQKRLYGGPALLSDVSVGVEHVAALVHNNGSGVGFWRRSSGGFPSFVRGEFKSLTSGRGFSCGIDAGSNNSVRCWGRRGGAVQEAFANVSMSSIVAGDSRVCGFRKDGVLTCTESGGKLRLPFGLETELSGVALGASQSCAIRQSNGTVLCWRETDAGNTTYSPANDTSFVLLAAGANLTCGLNNANYSIVCWGTETSVAPKVLPLPKILPGFCTSNQSSCHCGVFPDSETLCSVSGVICNPCNSKAPNLNPSAPSISSPKKKTSRLWLVYAIVGSVGGVAGICTVLYCLMTGVCRQKRVHNSVQPTISALPAPPQATVISPVQSTPRTRSRIFRQGSRAMRRQRSGSSKGNGNGNGKALSPSKAEAFTFDELAAATKNFSLENKVGGGSFGAVYRGKLPDGREVAIKRSESDADPETETTKKLKEKASQETAFRSELAFLSRLHHKHLVCLIGYCEEKDERMLVYEYMSNGSLFDHLHPAGGAAAAADGGPVLGSWKMRINVLLDAARGIEYLHNYAVPPIIHRDIKSSNILLDGSWVAKVSDFGLSLAGGGGEEQSPLGTVGYMDPEYYGLRHLTAKSDVYGLGVVMLETLTGRRAIYKAEGGKLESVVDYAVPEIAAGALESVLDRRAAPPAAGEAEAVELVAYTAVRCVSLEGRERPSMADVVDNLERAAALCRDDFAAGGYSSNSIRSAD